MPPMNQRRVDLEADGIKQEGVGNSGSLDRLLPAVHGTSWVVHICTRSASCGQLEVVQKWQGMAGECVRVYPSIDQAGRYRYRRRQLAGF